MADLLVAAPAGQRTAGRRARPSRAALGLGVLAAGAVALAAVYLLGGLQGNWAFLLSRRAVTLATLALVATAVGVSTVLFHTVTANRILTPSIMGLDSLYLLLQTVVVFVLGAVGASTLPAAGRYIVELVAMVGFSLALFAIVLGRLTGSLTTLLLVGVLLGGLFRGAGSFLQRLMAPEEFVVLSDRFFADFTGADVRLLGVSAALVLPLCALAWSRRHELDVLALGRELSICLGVRHRRASIVVLAGVSLLVGVSTALVGPTLFLGLIASHLAYRALGCDRHAWTLPASALAGTVALVGGQLVFERMLGLEGSLSMVVEFAGGVAFIALLLSGTRR